MKQERKHIDCLDYLRGVAILFVFLYHCLGFSFDSFSLPWNGWFPSFATPNAFLMVLPPSYGWVGVAIFFVVSGFCIHMSFEQQGREWTGVFIRRFFRIYPAYLLTLLVFALLFPITQLDFSSGHDGWSQLISHLLLIHNFNPLTTTGIDGPLWTIAVEVQLYLIYPLLLMLVAKSGWRRTMFVLAVCEMSMIFYPKFGDHPLLRFFFCVISWVAIMPLGAFWHRFCELPGFAFGKCILKKRTASIGPLIFWKSNAPECEPFPSSLRRATHAASQSLPPATACGWATKIICRSFQNGKRFAFNQPHRQ